MEPAVKDRGDWPLRLMFNWRFDWAKIKKVAGQVKILRDLSDSIIADDQGSKIKQVLGGELIEFRAEQPHVCGKVEPVILEQCLEKIKVFTTRPDTLFGATYLVAAPEHPLIKNLKFKIKNWPAVENYVTEASKRSEIERTAEGKDKTGIKIDGLEAINPANGEHLPIYAADYVLADYGFGAIMAVPAHDTRDWAFAKKFKLPIKLVIWDRSKLGDKSEQVVENVLDQAYLGEGILVNSGDFSGLPNDRAKGAITKFVRGRIVNKYKLRDWIFSRQRYWGEPIPMVFCAACQIKRPETAGWVPVPAKDLPVTLPAVKNYQPTDNGESPLAGISSWVKTKCPVCGGPARRETDTMPNWAGSSWYFLRYLDPKNTKAFADPKKLKYWLPVDWYNGGMEHTTLHLLYSRFWHKFLYDQGLVPTSEPYHKRTSHGLILAAGGEKMSKSKGNVINPDEIVKAYGADTLRLYEMFMGPFDQAITWGTDNIIGSRRFLDRVWRLSSKLGVNSVSDFSSNLQKTIQKVSADIELMSFNTAISAMMTLLNQAEKSPTISRGDYKLFLKILSPFAPHLTEELWSGLGEKRSIHLAPWPVFDASKIKLGLIKIVVQINGKVRDSFEVEVGTSEAQVKKLALQRPIIEQWTKDQKISRMVYVPEKLLNLVLV
jgi:leucyl-tRNA synthetase